MKQPAILIFDIGKTNKKWFLFSLDGQVMQSEQVVLEETTDEDGFPCENLPVLLAWMLGCVRRLGQTATLELKAMNVASYGASLVHERTDGQVLLPLYNYLTEYPKELQSAFLASYFEHDAHAFQLQTASPLMGSLNAGLQLFRLQQEQPRQFESLVASYHLPQYLAKRLGARACSDFTSIGCHTGLWDFGAGHYHSWVQKAGYHRLLAPLIQETYTTNAEGLMVGHGLHDSSSALIPYLQQATQPFVLVSTGTWCINLNPFNHDILTVHELQQDCLFFLQASGKPVKASRLFAGREHSHQLARIGAHFGVPEAFAFSLRQGEASAPEAMAYKPSSWLHLHQQPVGAEAWDLRGFQNAAQAYTALATGLCAHLAQSIRLVLQPTTAVLYVDGGFAANPIFLHCLKQHFPAQTLEVKGFPQATAMGAFLQVRAALAKAVAA